MIYDKTAASHVLGSLFLDPTLLNNPDYPLFPSDFGPRTHTILFSCLLNLNDQGAGEMTLQLVMDYLKKYPELDNFLKAEDGYNFLLLASEIANPKNFSFYHDRMRKMSLLRELSGNFDISEWYSEDLMEIGKRQVLEKKLENATIAEIIQSFSKKITDVEMKFQIKGELEIATLGQGILDLINNLEQKPELGLALEADIFNTITRGARKTKVYSVSGGTGVGKSRFATLQAASLAFPIRFNPYKNNWESTGKLEKVLLISTELKLREIQTMVLAFVSGVDEELILTAKVSQKERERLVIAGRLIDMFTSNFHFAALHDPTIGEINTIVRKIALEEKVDYIFYDYIHTSPKLLSEFSAQHIREDVILMMVSSALKNLANELDAFLWTGTQVNAQIDKQDFADENCLRGQMGPKIPYPVITGVA